MSDKVLEFFIRQHINGWWSRYAFILVPAQAYAANLPAIFKDFPPRRKPAAFNLDEVMRKLEKSPTGG